MLKTRTPTARTPLHHWHAAHGGRFTEIAGWEIVTAYSSPEQELDAARTGLGIVDISAFAKARVCGIHAQPTSQVVPLETASERWLACALTDEHLLLLSSQPQRAAKPPVAFSGLSQTDVTSALAGITVLGPCLEAMLRRLTHFDVRLAAFPINTCAATSLARVEALLVRPAEFILPSMRIYVAWELGEYVWERLMEAGRDWRIAPVGLRALELLNTD